MRNTLLALVALVALAFAGSAIAQTSTQGDAGSRNGDQVTRSERGGPHAAETNDSKVDRVAPPKKGADDEGDAPPAGCQYRGNKLDMLV